jgi:tol-pal system protein YbgF
MNDLADAAPFSDQSSGVIRQLKAKSHEADMIRAYILALSIVVLPSLAHAQSIDELQSRLSRAERDLRDLQAEVYRGAPRPRGPASDNILPNESAPLTQRVNDIEQSLRRLTGQVEELSHQISTLSSQLERMQKERAYDSGVGAAPDAPATGFVPAPDSDAQGAPRTLAPASGSLGTLRSSDAPPRPASSSAEPLPPPAPETNAQVQFDAGMKQLSTAQYEDARQSFRQYIDADPKAPRASEALYWSGDIAYSMQKKYDLAARDFAELIKRFPQSAEAPNGMLKLGLSLIALDQKKEGCAALAALPAKYPKAQEALLVRAKAESAKAACG